MYTIVIVFVVLVLVCLLVIRVWGCWRLLICFDFSGGWVWYAMLFEFGVVVCWCFAGLVLCWF